MGGKKQNKNLLLPLGIPDVKYTWKKLECQHKQECNRYRESWDHLASLCTVRTGEHLKASLYESMLLIADTNKDQQQAADAAQKAAALSDTTGLKHACI